MLDTLEKVLFLIALRDCKPALSSLPRLCSRHWQSVSSDFSFSIRDDEARTVRPRRICSDISRNFRIDTQSWRTMSIPKLRQVCEEDARSSRRQMVASIIDSMHWLTTEQV
jgi:hypothetical protein